MNQYSNIWLESWSVYRGYHHLLSRCLSQSSEVQTGTCYDSGLHCSFSAWLAVRHWGKYKLLWTALIRLKVQRVFPTVLLKSMFWKAGIYWVNLIDTFCAGWILLVAGLLEVLGLSILYGKYIVVIIMLYYSSIIVLPFSKIHEVHFQVVIVSSRTLRWWLGPRAPSSGYGGELAGSLSPQWFFLYVHDF